MTNYADRLYERLCKSQEENVFIDSLINNPEDPEILQIYAVWLRSQCDVRGEYLRLVQADRVSFEKLRKHCKSSRQKMRILEAEIDPLWLGFIHGRIPGRVTRITDEAISVNIDGVEGEISITDMPW